MINTVIIQGRLTDTPELKYTEANNIAVCNFSVACERPKRSGEEKITDFFDCVAWRTRAEFLERNFRKGDMIALSGKLFSESYTDKNDNKRTAVKIRVTEINFSGLTKKQKQLLDDDGIPEKYKALMIPPDDTDDDEDDDLPF